MKKKVLVTASTFPRWENDTEPRFILDLCKELNKYYDITVAAPSCPGAKNKEVLEGVKVERYRYLPVKKWETLCYPGAIMPRIEENKTRALQIPFLLLGLWVYHLRNNKKYDLIHAHWLIPQGIIQSFSAEKFIVTGHGDDVKKMNHGIVKILKKRTLKNASKVVVVSQALEKSINENYDNQSCEVISMGCDLSKFVPRAEDVILDKEDPTIVYVGRLVERKGVEYLIRAMHNVDAKLHIYGDGPNYQALLKESEKYNGKVKFFGPKTHDELIEIYKTADIVAVPSITTKNGECEGLPVVVLEALATGTPIVATVNGGIPEAITDRVNGMLVNERSSEELAQAINELIENQDLYKHIKQNGIQTAKKYSYQYLTKRYINIYEEVLMAKES